MLRHILRARRYDFRSFYAHKIRFIFPGRQSYVIELDATAVHASSAFSIASVRTGSPSALDISNLITVPFSGITSISRPPISERLAASPKIQLWPVVTEGPKVFPKLGASGRGWRRCVGGRCHTQHYGAGLGCERCRPMCRRYGCHLPGNRAGKCNLQKCLVWRLSDV